MHIVTSPWRTRFNAFVASATKTVRIAAPYYADEPIEHLLQTAPKKAEKFFLLALSKRCVKSRAQSVSAIRRILKHPSAQLRFVKNLHAKFFIADKSAAIVTSANLTRGGLRSNVEMGVHVTEPEAMNELVTQFDALWQKAKEIDSKTLQHYAELKPDSKSKGSDGDSFGAHVGLGKPPKHPPSPDTPALGWILVHSERAYQLEYEEGGKWMSPIDQLRDSWKEGVTKEHTWSWTSPKMRASLTKRRVLLAWKGEVFADAVATIEKGVNEDDYPYYFVLSKFRWAKPRVSFYDLPLGHRRRHHRSLIRLDEKIVAAYDEAQT